jgi:hypothetical protein
MKKNNLFALALLFLFIALMNRTKAQSSDPHFPQKGKFQIGLLTTYTVTNPPPVLIGNINYGLSRKTAIGLVGGTTGTIGLYALRLNSILLQKDALRILFRMTSIYYPKRHGRFLFDRQNKHVMPWMLSMGTLDAEWSTKSGFRWAVGVGVIETHCVDDMKKWFSKSKFKHEGSPDIFSTIQSGLAIPLSKKWLLRPEVFFVLQNGRLIEKEKFKVTFPVNPYLNLIYSL